MAINKQLDFVFDTASIFSEIEEKEAIETVMLEPCPAQRDEEMQSLLTRNLHRKLQIRCTIPVVLTITDNASTMMSVRYFMNGMQVRVRLHHMFLTAPREVYDALAYWVRHPRSRKYGALFNGYIASQNHKIRHVKPRMWSPAVRDHYYDLKKKFNEVNQYYFENSVTASISWGRECGRTTRSIRFGGYYPDEHLIRIHPRLDQSFVPEYILEYIVYHEMLHAYIGIEQKGNGRRNIHSQKFKQMEKEFIDYELAVGWIENKKNFRRLLHDSSRRP